MKKLYSICIILFLIGTGQSVLAQQIGDLKGIHFQAVAIDDNGKEIIGMDINGKPVYNKTIGVRFSILKGQSGPVLYQETHSTLTDQHGLFSLVIGQGELSTEGQYSTLMEIPWIDADQFLKVEIAINNDGNYKLVSLQQFMAVPYSFYTDDIADNAITTAKILDEEILSQDIKNETILAEDIAEGAVTSAEILDETIVAADIAEGAVTSSEILDGTVINADIADATIDLTTKVTGILPVANGGTGVDGSVVTDGQVLIGNGTNSNFDLATLTSGTGIQIVNTPGGIQIASTIQGVNTQETDEVTVGNIAAGANFVTQVTLQGVAPGDFVVASFSNPLQGCLMSGYVRNNNQIEVAIFNGNNAQKNLGSGTFKVLVIK
jgi:hypothetical protein